MSQSPISDWGLGFSLVVLTSGRLKVEVEVRLRYVDEKELVLSIVALVVLVVVSHAVDQEEFATG